MREASRLIRPRPERSRLSSLESESPSPAPPPPAAAALTPAPSPPPAAKTPVATAPPARIPSGPQLAAVAPAARLPGEAPTTRLVFEKGGAELSESARRALAGVLGELKRDEESRLTLLAYADVADDADSQSRRLSLSRALAVRGYLVEQGIRGTRMDVRALGNRAPDGPADRVDVVLLRR